MTTNMIVQDYYGRAYTVIDVGLTTTLLKCHKTGANVRIRSHGWADICFIKP